MYIESSKQSILIGRTIDNFPILENSYKSSELIKHIFDDFNIDKSKSLFSTKITDPLLLIDSMLSNHVSKQLSKADSIAKEIEKRSNAIAEINRIWGLIMQERLPSTNPNNNDQTKLGGGIVSNYLDKVDSIIKNDLSSRTGIANITGHSLTYSKDSLKVSYSTLQQMNATMTAFCDTIQVDLDTQQQKFKNTMTQITSAQEEIRDLRRAMLSLSKF
ncbi:hypothetical protein [Vibrio cholerae]|uniref:hypothetical protein n=1 Tax=Vibrio cholerae TaxID=666 RepID=UPI002D8C89E1|nr:hypothetical protein [Vibrio cholerae]MEB5517839.1 hypothetical protein [Vibrio cholerae]